MHLLPLGAWTLSPRAAGAAAVRGVLTALVFLLWPHRQRVRRGGGGLRGVGQRRVLDHRERHQLRGHPQLHVHERRRGEALRLPGSRL